jgi:hypothetical protein
VSSFSITREVVASVISEEESIEADGEYTYEESFSGRAVLLIKLFRAATQESLSSFEVVDKRYTMDDLGWEIRKG